jgi:hypothetical protein
MGRLHERQNWVIRVQGSEPPPVHVHVVHPDGKAIVYLGGGVTNSGVPAEVLKAAKAWVDANSDAVRVEWARLNNPPTR